MIWKEIQGFDGKYLINEDGAVKSLYRDGAILKQSLMTSGYKMVVLKKNKLPKCVSIHRMLAIHFIENSNHGTEVNHKNGLKTDNRLENLEWVTRSQNIQHAYDTGLKKYRPLHYKGKFGFAHNRSRATRCIETGKVYGSQSEAQRKLNLGNGSVSWSIKHKKPIFGMHFEVGS